MSTHPGYEDTAEFEPIASLHRQGQRVRLGVLGASRVFEMAIAGHGDEWFSLDAVAARDEKRARLFADTWNIERAYGSYQELIDDEKLDAIYVALPCSEHAEATMSALRAGKHVLCEKPFSLSVKEAKAAVELAQDKRLLLMEAHHWRFHPLVPHVEHHIRELGVIEEVEISFVAGVDDLLDIRRNPRLGAGVTMDFGCYGVQWMRWVSWAAAGKWKVPRVMEVQMIESAPGVDEVVKARLFCDGMSASLYCDMRPQTPFSAHILVRGEGGTLRFSNPLGVAASSLELTTASKNVHIEPNETTTYREQLRAFYHALRTGETPFNSGSQIVTTQFVLDQLYEVAGLPSRTALRDRAYALDRA